MADVTTHTETYLSEMLEIIAKLDHEKIEQMADELVALRERGGRLFLAGLGGSAANCSHAANDFRKLVGIDAICLSDNVAELTACANDLGWSYIYDSAMLNSRANPNDALMILSVGGGVGNVSTPLIVALNGARIHAMKIFGIVGKDGGETAKHADCCIIIPTVEYSRVTPHTEAFQMVILHCLVSHPKLQVAKTKW